MARYRAHRQRVEGTWSWTTHHRVYVPERRITTRDSRHVYVPLRGYSSHLAVFVRQGREHKCIGWIDTRTLGHETAKAWMAATDWKDQGI